MWRDALREGDSGAISSHWRVLNTEFLNNNNTRSFHMSHSMLAG